MLWGNPLCLLSKHSLYHSSFIIEPDISDVVWLVQSIMMLLQCSGIPSLCVIEVGWNFSNHFMILFAHSIDYTCLSLQMFSNISFSVMKPSAPTPGKQWWICFMSLLISFLFYSFISMELWMFIIYHSRCLFLKGSQVTPRLCSYNWLFKPKFKRFVLFNSPCVQSSVPECQNGLQSRIWHPQHEFAVLQSWELSKCLINTSQRIMSEHRIIKH